MVIQYYWIVESSWFLISVSYKQQRKAKKHNHKMKFMDMLKQNKTLKNLVSNEIANGYQFNQIFWNMQGYYYNRKGQQLLTAGKN